MILQLKSHIKLTKKYTKLIKLRQILKKDYILIAYLGQNSDFRKLVKNLGWSFLGVSNNLLKKNFLKSQFKFTNNLYGNSFLLYKNDSLDFEFELLKLKKQSLIIVQGLFFKGTALSFFDYKLIQHSLQYLFFIRMLLFMLYSYSEYARPIIGPRNLYIILYGW